MMSHPLPRIVGGLYEAFHAVPDLVASIRHWQSFGYRVGAEGCLDASAAKKLYDVALDLRSVRLYHQTADHGLVRLMMWEGAIGDGLGARPIRGLGTRWTGQKTLNMARLNDHAVAAQSLGEEICVSLPSLSGLPRLISRRHSPKRCSVSVKWLCCAPILGKSSSSWLGGNCRNTARSAPTAFSRRASSPINA